MDSEYLHEKYTFWRNTAQKSAVRDHKSTYSAFKAGYKAATEQSDAEVPIDLDDDTLLKMLIMAHNRNMTFNQLVELALLKMINRGETSTKIADLNSQG